jgi:hypothetical protein
MVFFQSELSQVALSTTSNPTLSHRQRLGRNIKNTAWHPGTCVSQYAGKPQKEVNTKLGLQPYPALRLYSLCVKRGRLCGRTRFKVSTRPGFLQTAKAVVTDIQFIIPMMVLLIGTVLLVMLH